MDSDKRRLVAAFFLCFATVLGIALIPAVVRALQPIPSLAAEAEVARDISVRVVYPPTNATASPNSRADAAVVAMQAPGDADRLQADATVTAANIDAVLKGVADIDPGTTSPANVSTSKVDLNTASVEELDGLSGAGRIGHRIVRHRPYRSVEDLLNKRVLRRRTFERIKDEVAAE